MSLLVVEAPVREGHAHSAVRLYSRGHEEYLALSVQES